MNFVEQYKELNPIYEGFAQSLIVLLRSILDANSIKYHLIEGRSKEIESFKTKIETKKGKYKNPLKEVMDLCGVRIIVYYQTDIDKIDSLINSIRSHLPEWIKFKDFNAEIQLRTVLQHSWAAISHELEYKSKFDIPDLLKRKLFRLAGLFELADEQFVQVKEKQFELSQAIENKTDVENISVYNELNLDTVKHYFSENQSLLNEYWKFAKNSGFQYMADDDDGSNSYYSLVVNLSKKLGLTTIEELNETLEKSKEFAEEYIKLQFLGQEPDESGKRFWVADEIFIICLVLMSLLNENELKNFNSRSWSENILDRVKEIIQKWNKSK